MRLLCVLLLLVCAGSRAFAREPDFVFEEKIVFSIRQSKARYELSSETSIRQVFVSRRSLSDNVLWFPSPSFAPIDDLRVRLNDKSVKDAVDRKVRPKPIELFNDDELYELTAPAYLKEGDTLAISYSQKYAEIANLPLIVVPNINVVASFRVVFQHPAEIRIEPEFYFPHGRLSYHMTATSQRETILTIDSLFSPAPLPYFAFNDRIAVILVTVWADSVRLTPTSPQSFVDWFSKRAPLAISLDSSWESALSDELRATNDSLLYADINRYINEHIRYIADHRDFHGVIPHEPKQVLSNEYGDCKDRAYLAVAMANGYERPLRMAAIATEATPPFMNVHSNLWNHVICAYESGGKWRFFDPTAEHHSFSSLPSSLLDRMSLILSQESPEIVSPGIDDTLPTVQFSIAGGLESPADMKALVTLRGDDAAMARQLRKDETAAKFDEQLGAILSSRLTQIGVHSVSWLSDNGEEVRLSAVADLSHFVARSPDNCYFPRSPFTQLRGDILSRESDTLPLHFDTLVHIDFSLAFSAPGVSTNPVSVTLGTMANGYFASRLAPVRSDSIVYHAEVARYPKVYAGAEREQFLQFCREYFAARNTMFLLKGITE